jgi:hypothetical protein
MPAWHSWTALLYFCMSVFNPQPINCSHSPASHQIARQSKAFIVTTIDVSDKLIDTCVVSTSCQVNCFLKRITACQQTTEPKECAAPQTATKPLQYYTRSFSTVTSQSKSIYTTTEHTKLEHSTDILQPSVVVKWLTLLLHIREIPG